MKTILSTEITEVIQATHYRPAVSIILPLEPQIRLLKELKYLLKITAGKVEIELMKDYPNEICKLIMKKIRLLTTNIKMEAHKKSLAIYVSPVFEKILFMDVPVQERIVIDESFEIRDLIYDKKHDNQYLLLFLSAKQGKIYLGNTMGFRKISSPVLESIYAYVNKWPEHVFNFTHSSEHKRIITLKFLQQIDKAMGNLIHEYQLPVFVLGSERILEHFKKLTRHRGAIADYIPGDYSHMNFSLLKGMMESHLSTWQHRKQQEVIDHLEVAASKKKLTTGIRSVWQAAMNNTGHNLIVEKNFVFSAQRGNRPDVIEEINEPFNKFSHIKDAVDDIIEKVVVNGGDVDFVEPNTLKAYDRIALVNY